MGINDLLGGWEDAWDEAVEAKKRELREKRKLAQRADQYREDPPEDLDLEPDDFDPTAFTSLENAFEIIRSTKGAPYSKSRRTTAMENMRVLVARMEVWAIRLRSKGVMA